MNKKGFTLVELLAVIVILAIIAIITIPMIGNVIEDSKKKALETSVYGLVEAANYFAIYNDEAHVVFGSEAIKDPKEILDYSGEVDAEGDLYIDKDGDVSLCLMNEKYYVYKNYNSGIIIGDRSKGNCVAKHDPLTNKYIAYLEGEGEGSNVYSKDEVDTLVDGLQRQITSNDTDIENLNILVKTNQDKITTLEGSINDNTSEITTIKDEITDIQTNLSSYATKTELETTNGQLQDLSDVVNDNRNNIDLINNKLSTMNAIEVGTSQIVNLPFATLTEIAFVDVLPGTYLVIGSSQVSKSVESNYQLHLDVKNDFSSSNLGITRNIGMGNGGGGNVISVLNIQNHTTITLNLYSLYNGTETIQNNATYLYAIKLS